MFGFLRRFIRRKTKPIPVGKAFTLKEKISLLYAFIAWNGFGFLIYLHYKGVLTNDESYGKLTQAEQYAKFLDMKNVRILRYQNFSKIGDKHYKDFSEETTESEKSS